MSTAAYPHLVSVAPNSNTATSPVCGACDCPDARRVRTLSFPGYPGPFHLWRCRDCGLVFNWPRLTPEQTRQQYDGGYYVFNSRPEHRWSRATQLYLNYLAPLESCNVGGRLLEIGCAQGHLLAIANSRGWQAEGVEISAEAAEAARTRFRLPIRAGTLEDQGDELCRFDVIIATDVIEHIADPRAFLRAVCDRLMPGGLAVIETPNWGGFWRRLGGRRWLGLNRFHISLFDSHCLARLMNGCGLTTVATFTTTNTVCSDWGSRPELTRFLPLLPPGLQWRAQGRLSGITPESPERALQQKPPASLSAALERVAAMKEERTNRLTTHEITYAFPADYRLIGDNLAVIGRAARP